jgi:hypothetical protein
MRGLTKSAPSSSPGTASASTRCTLAYPHPDDRADRSGADRSARVGARPSADPCPCRPVQAARGAAPRRRHWRQSLGRRHRVQVTGRRHSRLRQKDLSTRGVVRQPGTASFPVRPAPWEEPVRSPSHRRRTPNRWRTAVVAGEEHHRVAGQLWLEADGIVSAALKI